ncbi:hypothetical protein DQ04_01141090 [Trypanosoma grayi]|uniref:hypothetical protein n=1 Tax=Trypanosoma grayi TaxID=71804 RepID=UPI0004F44FE4|nr:hypothetical protein DQ04_01141090 [Trypanosoma grayi]KEG13223.1 hypothetical protein DQ04_01141090 [Trypanosoma grayi]
MSGIQAFLSAIVEALILAFSCVLLFVPLLYLGSHQQCVVYGSLMTTALAIAGGIRYFFGIARPIGELSRLIQETQRSFATACETQITLQNYSAASNSLPSINRGPVHADFMEDRRRIEKALGAMKPHSKVTHHHVQVQQRAVRDLLASILKWQDLVVEKCRRRSEEAMGTSLRDEHGYGASSQRNGGSGRNSPQKIRSLPPELSKGTLGAIERRTADDHVAVAIPRASQLELTQFSPLLPEGHSLGKKEDDSDPWENQEGNATSRRKETPSSTAGVFVDGEYPHLRKGDLKPQLPQASESGTKEKRVVVANNTSSVSSSFLAVEETQKERRTFNRDAPLGGFGTALTMPPSQSVGSVFTMPDSNAQDRSENGGTTPLTLVRGNRCATDNHEVFFHVTVRRPDAVDTTIVFEAFVDRDALPEFCNNEQTPRFALRQASGLPELAPFEGLSITAKGERTTLNPVERDLVGFISCEVEPNPAPPLLSVQEMTPPPPQAEGKEQTGAVEEGRCAFVLSWAVLPDLPIRLTMLRIRLEGVGMRTVPVLECLINDVFSILTSAVVWVEPANGTANSGRAVSVKLEGVSIENSSEDERSEGDACDTRNDVLFGMPVSSTIML